jgi:hypothetical protein
MRLLEISAALAGEHPGHDIAINSTRLFPREGWLVEYEHWGEGMRPQVHCAFVGFGTPAGYRVKWTSYICERKESY